MYSKPDPNCTNSKTKFKSQRKPPLSPAQSHTMILVACGTKKIVNRQNTFIVNVGYTKWNNFTYEHFVRY